MTFPKKSEGGVYIVLTVVRSFPQQLLRFLEEKIKSFKNVQFDSEAFPVSQDKSATLWTSQVRGPQASMCCLDPGDRIGWKTLRGVLGVCLCLCACPEV